MPPASNRKSAGPRAAAVAPRTPTPAYIHLLRAKDLMDRHYAEPLEVDTLAREAYASPAHFARSFKRAFGETPHRSLLRRRIERARDLLRRTDMPVTAVSLEVGFASLSSFSRAFRELAGERPSEYASRWATAAPAPIPACFELMYTRPGSSSPGQADGRGGA